MCEESDKKTVARLEEVKTITEPEGDYEQIMEEAMEDVDYDQITVDYTQPEQAQQLKVHIFKFSKIGIFADISNLNSIRPAQILV